MVSERAIVMAGLAKEVDAVNQYAAPIQAATIHGASSERSVADHNEQQTEGCHGLRKPLGGSGTHVCGELPDG